MRPGSHYRLKCQRLNCLTCSKTHNYSKNLLCLEEKKASYETENDSGESADQTPNLSKQTSPDTNKTLEKKRTELQNI